MMRSYNGFENSFAPTSANACGAEYACAMSSRSVDCGNSWVITAISAIFISVVELISLLGIIIIDKKNIISSTRNIRPILS